MNFNEITLESLTAFLVYGLLILPVFSTFCALFLQDSLLYPYQQWIAPVLLAAFLLTGILVSVRHTMAFRIRLK